MINDGYIDVINVRDVFAKIFHLRLGWSQITGYIKTIHMQKNVEQWSDEMHALWIQFFSEITHLNNTGQEFE